MFPKEYLECMLYAVHKEEQYGETGRTMAGKTAK